MRIKFRGKVLNVKNEYHSRTDFLYHFEMYTIEIEKFDGQWYYYVSSDELPCYVSDCSAHLKMAGSNLW